MQQAVCMMRAARMFFRPWRAINPPGTNKAGLCVPTVGSGECSPIGVYLMRSPRTLARPLASAAAAAFFATHCFNDSLPNSFPFSIFRFPFSGFRFRAESIKVPTLRRNPKNVSSTQSMDSKTPTTKMSLVMTIICNYEFRDLLLSMLRPMDIVSLLTATCVTITKVERAKYLILWRQIFFDMKWLDILKANGCTVTVLGTDFGKLVSAIRRWDHTLNTSTLKYVLVISPPLSPLLRRPLQDSTDTTVGWVEVPSWWSADYDAFFIHESAESCQIHALSHELGSQTNLNHTWSKALCSPDHSSYVSTVMTEPGKKYAGMIVWKTEWQQLDGWTTIYKPTEMSYVMEPDDIDEYITELTVSPVGLCAVIIKRGNDHEWAN
jgi:hypothetical protein